MKRSLRILDFDLHASELRSRTIKLGKAMIVIQKFRNTAAAGRDIECKIEVRQILFEPFSFIKGSSSSLVASIYSLVKGILISTAKLKIQKAISRIDINKQLNVP